MQTPPRKFLQALTLCLGLVSLCTIPLARTAHAGVDEPNSRRLINALPVVGIATGQTLHITFLATGDNPFEIIPCIFNGRGEDVREGTSMTLVPGQMRSIDVRWGEVAQRTESRAELHTVVHLNAQDIRHLVVTGEIVDDATGKSSLYLPSQNRAREAVRSRQETTVLTPVGFTFGQTVHLTFLNMGDAPFELEPCYLDGDGVEIKEGAPFILPPGQMRSFDLSRSEVDSRVESRLQIRAVVHARQSDLKNLSVTGEVIEEESGRSSLLVPGLRVGFDPQPDPPAPN